MKRNFYNILREPTGSQYSSLLDYALKECNFFLLVTDRDNRQLSPAGKAVLNELAPFLYRMEMKSEWPGTVLSWGQVPIYTYHYIEESVSILKKSATRLYQWQRPDLPDDLCLLRPDETPWLVTIAHENDSYFELSENEIRHLLKSLPSYKTMIEIAKQM
jgi:hypothetical protein